MRAGRRCWAAGTSPTSDTIYSGFRNVGAGITFVNYSRPAEWFFKLRIIG
jgi:hypothetical protein